MKDINIFIVDDHKIIREGLSAIFLMTDNINVLEEASNYDELQVKLNKKIPDVIIMDIELPGKSGIEITEIITEKYPSIKVLVLSSYIDFDTIQDAIKKGAKGFLPKDSSSDELINAIYALYNNDEYFGEQISKVIMKNYLKDINKPTTRSVDEISEREKEIVILFAEGLSYKQIADRLFISPKTVDTHKRNIQEKLNLKTTVDLVKYAIKNKLVEL